MRVSQISADDIRILVNIASNSSCLKNFHIEYDDLSEYVTDQFLDSLIGEKQINKAGKLVRLTGDTIRAFENALSNSLSLKNFHIDHNYLNEHVTEQFLDSSIGEEQTDQSGEQVRLIGINTRFVHNSDSKTICMYTFSDKKEDESVESSKKLTSLPENSAMLCLSNHLIMEKIVRHFDFAELVVLRRVSSGSRRCVDLLKPDPKLVAMKISVIDSIIIVEVFGINNNTRLSYKAHDADIPATPSFFAVFPVEKLDLTTTCLKQAARILQNMDPLSIKSIEIRPYLAGTIVSHIEELVCLEQWTNAEELKIQGFVVECSLEKLVHFSKVDIWLQSISMEDVLYLKEKLLSSSNFCQFKTKFSKTDANDSIFEDNFLGDPFRRVEDILSDQPDIWFFPYPNSMENLQIRYYQKAKEFMFKRIPRR